MSDRTEAEAIAGLAYPDVKPFKVNPTDVHAVVVRDGHGRQEVVYIDRDDLLDEPRRKTGTFKPTDLASFIHYTENHHDDDRSTIWIERDHARITAVFNDHSDIEPGWGDHKALLTLERTPEWMHWKSNDHKLFDQTAFAEHIQQGISEIVIPDPATMLEVAQSIQGRTEATWRTARRLDNGETAFGYVETVEATAGRQGSLEIPSEFVLNVSPFYGEDLAPVTARLRYRIREGALLIGYQLVQPHQVELGVLAGIRDRLAEKFPRVYMGTPAR